MLAELAALVADVDAALALLAALVAEVLALDAWVVAVLAELLALEAELDAAEADEAAAVALLAALVAYVTALATSAALTPGVGLPLASNDSVLLARAVRPGKVILMLVGSVCGAWSARCRPSAFCCAKMVC